MSSSNHSCTVTSLRLKEQTIGIETDGSFTQFWLPLNTALCMDIRLGDLVNNTFPTQKVKKDNLRLALCTHISSL